MITLTRSEPVEAVLTLTLSQSEARALREELAYATSARDRPFHQVSALYSVLADVTVLSDEFKRGK